MKSTETGQTKEPTDNVGHRPWPLRAVCRPPSIVHRPSSFVHRPPSSIVPETAPTAICRKVARALNGGTIPVWGEGSAVLATND